MKDPNCPACRDGECQLHLGTPSHLGDSRGRGLSADEAGEALSAFLRKRLGEENAVEPRTVTVREWFRQGRAEFRRRHFDAALQVEARIDRWLEPWTRGDKFPKPIDGPAFGIGEDLIHDYDLLAHLREAVDWSFATFGPGRRTVGVVSHIRKELAEIEREPEDPEEWIDVAILAFDGAWRTGTPPREIVRIFRDKFARNRARRWPNWRETSESVALEHVRAETIGTHASPGRAEANGTRATDNGQTSASSPFLRGRMFRATVQDRADVDALRRELAEFIRKRMPWTWSDVDRDGCEAHDTAMILADPIAANLAGEFETMRDEQGFTPPVPDRRGSVRDATPAEIRMVEDARRPPAPPSRFPPNREHRGQ